jgi:hypothetical protein
MVVEEMHCYWFLRRVLQVINETVWLANIAPNISRKTLQDVQFKGETLLIQLKNIDLSCRKAKPFYLDVMIYMK